mmetsp:Transcript_88860/g.259716  ORF Transcript_88860/g.259716 Transcript_88860/m.259716 type:complete len:278 (+) Transcript_88860:1250-2083(+)
MVPQSTSTGRCFRTGLGTPCQQGCCSSTCSKLSESSTSSISSALYPTCELLVLARSLRNTGRSAACNLGREGRETMGAVLMHWLEKLFCILEKSAQTSEVMASSGLLSLLVLRFLPTKARESLPLPTPMSTKASSGQPMLLRRVMSMPGSIEPETNSTRTTPSDRHARVPFCFAGISDGVGCALTTAVWWTSQSVMSGKPSKTKQMMLQMGGIHVAFTNMMAGTSPAAGPPPCAPGTTMVSGDHLRTRSRGTRSRAAALRRLELRGRGRWWARPSLS